MLSSGTTYVRINRGNRRARPRLARVAPSGLEKASVVVSPGPGADAPRLRTVAPSELEESLSPPRLRTYAARRKTGLTVCHFVRLVPIMTASGSCLRRRKAANCLRKETCIQE